MTLIELKELVQSTKKGTVFEFGISDPYSWRGSYDEVCFTIKSEKTTRGAILKNINKAFSRSFYGYKGGEYSYNDWTNVNFERDFGSWSDGRYCMDMIALIQGEETYSDNEEKLVHLILNKRK